MNTIRVAVIAIIVMLGNQMKAYGGDHSDSITCGMSFRNNAYMTCQRSPTSGSCTSDKQSLGTIKYWAQYMTSGINNSPYDKQVRLHLYLKATHVREDELKKTRLSFKYRINPSDAPSTTLTGCTKIIERGDGWYICEVDSPKNFFACNSPGENGGRGCWLWTDIYASLYGQGQETDSQLEIAYVYAAVRKKQSNSLEWSRCTSKVP